MNYAILQYQAFLDVGVCGVSWNQFTMETMEQLYSVTYPGEVLCRSPQVSDWASKLLVGHLSL